MTATLARPGLISTIIWRTDKERRNKVRYNILERLKSPVVVVQIIVSIFAVVTAFTGENYDNLIAQITTIVTALFALFASINNPVTPNKL